MTARAARVQLRRTKGWRKPEGVIVVARPSRWGNPFRIGADGDREACVARFAAALRAGELGFTVADVRRRLAGRDLACWCPLDVPCHADVLLDEAAVAPSVGFEPTPPAPEAGALSPELRGRGLVKSW